MIEISTDPTRIDVDAVHAYLTRAYWCEGISKDLLAKAIAGSLCFALFDDARQIGFDRVVTDRATFAFLEEYTGQGLGKRLMQEVQSHPDLQGLRRFVLVTRDAHGLYNQFGFEPLKNPTTYMEIHHPDIYKQDAS